MHTKEQVDVDYKRKIIGVLTVLFPDAKIYLFGSRARGTARHRSDIDIALDEGERIKPISRIAEARDMLNASDITKNVEIVDFHAVSSLMKQQILKDGIVWKA